MKKLILFMILSLNIFSGTNSEVIHNAFSKKYPNKENYRNYSKIFTV